MTYRDHAQTIKHMIDAASRGELSRVGHDFADAAERWMCIETIRHLSSDAGPRLQLPTCTGVSVRRRLGVDYDALDVEMSFQGRARRARGEGEDRIVRTTVRALGTRAGAAELDLVLDESSTDARWYLSGEAIGRDGGTVIDDSLGFDRTRLVTDWEPARV